MRHIPEVRRFNAAVAVHLFVISEDQILLSRRYNTGYEDGRYSVIAGHLEGGEEVVSAMAREAREEAGIEFPPGHLRVAGMMHRQEDDERIDFFLVADRWRGEIRNLEPEKCDQLAWFPLDGLPGNVVPYVRQAIENYRAGRWFDSFGWS